MRNPIQPQQRRVAVGHIIDPAPRHQERFRDRVIGPIPADAPYAIRRDRPNMTVTDSPEPVDIARPTNGRRSPRSVPHTLYVPTSGNSLRNLRKFLDHPGTNPHEQRGLPRRVAQETTNPAPLVDTQPRNRRAADPRRQPHHDPRLARHVANPHISHRSASTSQLRNTHMSERAGAHDAYADTEGDVSHRRHDRVRLTIPS